VEKKQNLEKKLLLFALLLGFLYCAIHIVFVGRQIFYLPLVLMHFTALIILFNDVLRPDVSEQGKPLTVAEDDAILHAIGQGLCVTNLEGVVTKVNKIFEEMVGYSAKELLGKKLANTVVMVNENGQALLGESRVVTRALAEGKAIVSNPESFHYYVRKDGTRFPIAYSTTPIYRDGKILGCVLVVRDITQEEQIDRAKTEFVSLASHQLKTPLSAISWFTELLMTGEAGKMTSKQITFLKEIYDSYKRMAELVDALLNTSRIDMGNFSISPKSCDLKEIAKDVVTEIKPELILKKHQLKQEFEKGLPNIFADPNLVRMIFQNLLTNSIKYTPDKGNILLHVGMDEKKKNFIISVKDNGYGIPESEKSKIFGKLYRADNIRSKVTEGTGLGLYIVKSVVDRSGGKVWFESEVNKGTSFYVTYPVTGMKAKAGTKKIS